MDPQQPAHVLAGWLVPADQRAAYAAAIVEAKLRNPQASEFKGKNLLPTPRGRETARRIISGALDVGALPVFVIVEKRYCVAAKMVETFLDPFHNDGAYWLPTGADIERQAIANVFYESPSVLLHDFANAYRDPNTESFARNIRALADYSNSIGRIDLSSSLLAQLDDLDRLVEAERAEIGTIKRNKWIAVNTFTFLSFIVLASNVIRLETDAEVEVVHDKTDEFEEAFKILFDGWRWREGLEILPSVLQSGTVMPPLVDQLTRFRIGEPKQEPEIQAADVLSSTLRWLAEGASIGREGQFDKELFRLTLWPLLPGSPVQHASLIASDDWTRRLLRPFREIL